MTLVSFPYTPISNRPNAIYPRGRTVYRPMVRVTLTAQVGKSYESFALADTGADSCLFPLQFAKFLGLDVSTLPSSFTAGVGTTANVTYYATIEVELLSGIKFESQVGFTEGMDRAGFGLLGQQGFFENFNVHFLHRQRRFTIEPS